MARRSSLPSHFTHFGSRENQNQCESHAIEDRDAAFELALSPQRILRLGNNERAGMDKCLGDSEDVTSSPASPLQQCELDWADGDGDHGFDQNQHPDAQQSAEDSPVGHDDEASVVTIENPESELFSGDESSGNCGRRVEFTTLKQSIALLREAANQLGTIQKACDRTASARRYEKTKKKSSLNPEEDALSSTIQAAMVVRAEILDFLGELGSTDDPTGSLHTTVLRDPVLSTSFGVTPSEYDRSRQLHAERYRHPLGGFELQHQIADDFEQRRTDRSIKASLMSIPMFQSLSDEQLSSLSDPRNYVRKSFARDDLIVRQFEVGWTLYLLLEGCVTIWKASEDEGDPSAQRSGKNQPGAASMGQRVCTLTAGASFGERALLSNGIRTASVRAETSVECIAIHKEVFEDVIAEIANLHDGYVPDKAQTDQTRTLSNHVREFVDKFPACKEKSDRPDANSRSMDQQEERLALELMALSSPELQVDDVIERMIRALQNYFQVEKLGLFLINHEDNTMLLRVSKDARGILLPIQGIAGHTARTGEIVNVRNAYEDDRFDSAMDKKTGHQTKQLLCVPVEDVDEYSSHSSSVPDDPKKRVIGVLQCVNRMHAKEFTAADVKLLQCAARQLRTVLKQRAQNGSALTCSCLCSHDVVQKFSLRIASLSLALGQRSSHTAALLPTARASVSLRLYHGRESLFTMTTVASSRMVFEERE